MRYKVPHQITLVAFQANEDGTRSIYDIVETSYRHAPRFVRGFMRNDEVSSFRACAPKTMTGREIDRRNARWPANKVPGRTPEEIAAETTAAIIAPNAEAMRLELAKRR